MKPEIIVAMDNFDSIAELTIMSEKLKDSGVILKIGKESFIKFGSSLLFELIEEQNHKIFLDLKLHDIPNTVANAVKAIADKGVWMTNIHCSGGTAMMEAAKEAVKDYDMKLIGVTVLTSLTTSDIQEIGYGCPVSEVVDRMAKLAWFSGLDGVVSSPLEVQNIKHVTDNSFLCVTPGVRWDPADYDKPYEKDSDDQRRTMTPREAQQVGSDYLVIGRPITQHPDPLFVVESLKDILTTQKEGDFMEMEASAL